MCCDKAISGIQCDNQECDYSIEVPTFRFKEFVNRPCPKCGWVLLTNSDMIAWNIIEAATESNLNLRSDNDKEENVILRSNGSGDIIIEEDVE